MRTSYLDIGTQMSPGERKFVDYAYPATYQPYNVVTNIGGRVGWHNSPLPVPFFPNVRFYFPGDDTGRNVCVSRSWVELWPAFDSYFKKNSLAANILADFKTALKANGMTPNHQGGEGQPVHRDSEASHLALRQLWDVLKELGYKLAKKSAHETTLRVYPTSYGDYPLLNPRFRATEADLDEAWDRECLEVTVLSKGDCIGLSRYLKKFCPTQDCVFLGPESSDTFLGPESSDTSYTRHGWFVMPLRFVGRGTNVEIDFTRLTDSLQRVRIFLSKAPHLAALPSARRSGAH